MSDKTARETAASDGERASGRESRATDSATPLVAGVRFGGDYSLVRRLGSGGMGEVWLAREEPLGREVALKVLRSRDERERARFLREAKLMAGAELPGVVRVLRFGTDAATGLAFHAADVCDGSLENRLADGRTLSEERVAELGLALAETLEALHAHDPPIVHRDLKPSNVLFASDGRPLLADFGVARTLAPDSATALTVAGLQPGTAAWAAPEQKAGAAPSPAMDWYAFGLVLFRALTGGMAGTGGGLPVDVAPDVSRRWAPLLRGLLRENPEERICDPKAVARELRAIRAWPRRRVRRARRLAAIAVVIGLLGAGALVRAMRTGAGNGAGAAPHGVLPPAADAATPLSEGGEVEGRRESSSAAEDEAPAASVPQEPQADSIAPEDVALARALTESRVVARCRLRNEHTGRTLALDFAWCDEGEAEPIPTNPDAVESRFHRKGFWITREPLSRAVLRRLIETACDDRNRAAYLSRYGEADFGRMPWNPLFSTIGLGLEASGLGMPSQARLERAVECGVLLPSSPDGDPETDAQPTPLYTKNHFALNWATGELRPDPESVPDGPPSDLRLGVRLVGHFEPDDWESVSILPPRPPAGAAATRDTP